MNLIKLKKNFYNKKIFNKSMSLRKRILQLSQKVSAIHIGGTFSSAEIIQVIFEKLNNKKDKFILSKGHAGVLLYSILEQKKILSSKTLDNYCKINGVLGVHPEIYLKGVEASTGSLGHGLAIAAGMALSKKYNNIFVLMSDGELMEGSVWEAALMISSFKLNNIKIIIDNNDLQSATKASDTHPTLYPIEDKFKSFGWKVASCNGHNPYEINKNLFIPHKQPLCLVCKTTKGYPIDFMMNVPKWHYRSPDKEQYNNALNQINKILKR
jgi:transketolase